MNFGPLADEHVNISKSQGLSFSHRVLSLKIGYLVTVHYYLLLPKCRHAGSHLTSAYLSPTKTYRKQPCEFPLYLSKIITLICNLYLPMQCKVYKRQRKLYGKSGKKFSNDHHLVVGMWGEVCV